MIIFNSHPSITSCLQVVNQELTIHFGKNHAVFPISIFCQSKIFAKMNLLDFSLMIENWINQNLAINEVGKLFIPKNRNKIFDLSTERWIENEAS